jgi:arylsulfatase A-like enzyme
MHRVDRIRPALLLLAVAGLGSACTGRGPSLPPNVVLIVWDTCRADRLSAFGHPRPTTPWLESFARTGVRYDRCFAPAPWTAPSHGSLFTGLIPSRHGLQMGRGDRIPARIPLLAETLSNAGYETVGFTANAYVSPVTGLDRGFRSFTTTCGPGPYQNGAGRSVEAVRRWIAARKPAPRGHRPFFLFVNLMDLHIPHDPPLDDVLAVLPPGVDEGALRKAAGVQQRDALGHLLGIRTLDGETLSGLGARYEGAVRFLDRKTGEIVDLLGKAGFLENAVVAVTADHGENLGEHGELDHRLSLYDTLLRVPLVLRRPGRYEGGGVVRSQVSLMDVYPTILEAVGVPVPAGTGSDALVLPPVDAPGRLLVAESASAEGYLPELRQGFPEAPLASFDRLFLSIRAVRDPEGVPRRRKYLRFERLLPSGARAPDREELYDVDADPGETRNLLLGPDPAERAEADRLRR